MSTIHLLSYPRLVTSVIFFIWYLIIIFVAYRGFFEILSKFSSPSLINDNEDEDELEPVSILRPIKGIDPELSTCLESSFLQNYPVNKFEIIFCIDDSSDPSIPIIENLISKYPHISAKILLSKDSPHNHFGPNPKVNNLSKGYLHAKYDILWLMDSNVWASPNILKNSVFSLINHYNNGVKLATGTNSRAVKLVHHVPLALSMKSQPDSPTNNSDSELVLSPITSNASSPTYRKRLLKKWGAKLDEMFLMTSHLKFYVSLNNLNIAPCVNGKSNMYRRSDLDKAVASIPSNYSPFFDTKPVKSDAKYYSNLGPGNGIKFFARYIGEDNMIGIALWEFLFGRTALTGDFVIQPLSGVDNSLSDYVKRRVRWLRVRKYMVLMATLVEPSTESIICGLFGTYAISSIFWNQLFNWKYFAFHMFVWILTDYKQYYTFIHNISNSNYNVHWLNKKSIPPLKRSFWNWLHIWILREILALPIWIIAMIGHEIDWRGKPFKIKKDLTAEEL